MKEYDLIVLGAGSGLIVADEAHNAGQKVALVEKDLLGGTCLNVGCIPSKLWITPADRIVEINESQKFGIHATVEKIDAEKIMEKTRRRVREWRGHIEKAVKSDRTFPYYHGEAHFVADYTLEVNGQRIHGKKIVIATGARPFIPPIPGINQVHYLTSDTVFDLKTPPESMIVIGGGYIGVELAHFLAAMGTKITIVQRQDRLLPLEDSDVSEVLLRALQKRMNIMLNANAMAIRKKGSSAQLEVEQNGKTTTIEAQTILVATGRQSNADLLHCEQTGVKLDEHGFIKVNGYFETTKKNVWAFGDAIGEHMFKHTANREAYWVWNNMTSKKKIRVDFTAEPHAVFSYPQIAGVGLTEWEAKQQGKRYVVKKVKYTDVAKGVALEEEQGFAKAVVEKGTGKILGFHIIGPEASILIQEVVNAMANGTHIRGILAGMHIHPALSELIPKALSE
jgi:dihydrolipoamide dehydrogenase